MENAATQTAEPVAEDRRDGSKQNQFRRSIYGVPISLTVAVGRQKVKVSDLLDMSEDTVIPMESRLEDPVELIVEGCVVALGELIEQEDGTLAVRITEIPEQRDA